MNKNRPVNTTHLLQFAVVFLALVSFFTTANGMKEYIFQDNGVIAYMASAAIQGILLALSMNLPGYLRGIWNSGWNGFFRFLMCLLAVLLTGVAIFCSSWFSYVYIAEVIHRDSWDTDSELLVQQTYREELYNAQEYAHNYRIYLEESLGGKILLLEEQSKELSDAMVDSGIEWDKEREDYVTNGGAAATYMAPVIDAMSRAARSDSSQEARDLAAKAVADAATSINSRMEAIQQRVDNLDRNITRYEAQIAALNNRIYNAAEGTDVGALTNAVNSYTALITNAVQEQGELEEERTQLSNALSRIPHYENYLGLNSSTSAISIRSSLVEMQSEFFKDNPDEEVMMDIAADIFESLRSAANTSGATSGTGFSYTDLLIQMNQLIRNLMDYSEIKDIEANLEQLITELRTEEPDAEAAQPTEPAQPALPTQPADPAETTDPGEPMGPAETTDPAESAEPAESGEPNQDAKPPEAPSGGGQSGGSGWQKSWGKRLDQLKSQVSARPVYSESDTDSSVLSESQANVLRSYDRNKASRTLDDMIRRYISQHSAIYQGIIYLQSPYRSLAIFALLLALAFDLTGFVFGVVIEGNPRQKAQNGGTPAASAQFAAPPVGGGSRTDETEWTVLETLEQYVVLTGDFESRDGRYYYKTFKDGKLYHWCVTDPVPYVRQIYIQYKANPSAGMPVPTAADQELCFAGQAGGPKDGIYTKCGLAFDEGSLIRTKNGQTKFLATVDEYVPVHSYDPGRGENRTIPAKRLAAKNIDAETAVVALNEKGTRIAAIYVIEG